MTRYGSTHCKFKLFFSYFASHKYFIGSDVSDSTGLRRTRLKVNQSQKVRASSNNRCATSSCLIPKRPMVSHPFGYSKSSKSSSLLKSDTHIYNVPFKQHPTYYYLSGYVSYEFLQVLHLWLCIWFFCCRVESHLLLYHRPR